MAIKDLAVAYNGSTNAKAALSFAIQMCKKYDAALSGLHVRAPVALEPHVQRWTPKSVLDSLREAADESLRNIEKSFRDVVAEEGFQGEAEWIVEEGPTNDHLARLARYYDLLIVGQFSEPNESQRTTVRAEDLVHRAGKPVIIVPHGYKVRPFEEYAAVAWDGSRAAALALQDAMQILETKKRLDVVSVGAEKSRAEALPGRDIMRHLKRHGIDARRVTLTGSRDSIGSTIMNYCTENKPDVLGMGAYGHARLREDLFGGVTRHTLKNMTVPVLMAH